MAPQRGRVPLSLRFANHAQRQCDAGRARLGARTLASHRAVQYAENGELADTARGGDADAPMRLKCRGTVHT
jgi:hypothetical protein